MARYAGQAGALAEEEGFELEAISRREQSGSLLPKS